MAAIIKLLYSSWVGNTLGWGVFATWLVIDFNDIKMIVLGIMAMVWAVGKGIISLYREYIKAQREKWELERDKTTHKPEKPKSIKSQQK